MSAFAETLRRIDARLVLPEPARTRVLLEVAADLEDLVAHFRDRGLAEAEAVARAIEECDLSDEALAALAAVHCSPYRRFLDRLAAPARTRWERVLAAFLLVTVAAGLLPTLSSRLVRTAGEGAIAIATVTALAVGLAAWKLYRIDVRQDRRLRRLRRGVEPLLALAAVDFVAGYLGTWIGLRRFLTGLAGDFEALAPRIADHLLREASLLVVALGATVVCLVLWFVVEHRVARVERAVADALLGADPQVQGLIRSGGSDHG